MSTTEPGAALEDVLLWFPCIHDVRADCPWCRRPSLRIDVDRRSVSCSCCHVYASLQEAVDARADAEMRTAIAVRV